MERCNYNVKYTDFIKALRSKALSEGTELQYSHGGVPQSVMRIMGQKSVKQKRLDWLPADIHIDKQSSTVFFVGCAPYFDIIFRDMGIKTTQGTEGALRLLNHAGIPFNLLGDERCCGSASLLLGDTDGFMSLARANMQELKKRGAKNIITNCPECYHALKVEYAKAMEDWDINVTHLTEVLAPLIDENHLKLSSSPKKITYQDPCTLGRYSRLFDEPRLLLNSVNGLELVEMADNRETALCCGASPWAYCGAVHKQIQKERLNQADKTKADLLVTACPKCLIHLTCAQKNADNEGVCKIEIQDMFHLLSQSLP